MHIKKLDLNLFPVLEAIYTEGSITRAAEALNLTQPAVSHALSRLREAFDDPLFIRHGNRMRPTAITQNVIGEIRESVNLLRGSVQLSRRFDPANAKKLFTVSLRDMMEGICLPPLMKHLELEAPNVTVTSAQVNRREMENQLASNAIDLAVDILLPSSENLLHQQINRDRFIVIARQGHPDIQGTLSLNTYLAQKHVLVSSRSRGLGIEDFELNRQGFERDIRLRCQHYFAACRVVSETDMLLTMPESYANIINAHVPSNTFSLPAPLPYIDAYLYWHRNMDNDPANRWLRQSIQSLTNSH